MNIILLVVGKTDKVVNMNHIGMSSTRKDSIIYV